MIINAVKCEDEANVCFFLTGALSKNTGKYDLISLRDLSVHAIECGMTEVIFDLRDVVFIDGSALGTFIQILKSARSEGGCVRIRSVLPYVREVFKLTKVDVFFCWEDEDCVCQTQELRRVAE